MLTEEQRPTWLPAPPSDLGPRTGAVSRHPRATLVSVAIGAAFERKLDMLRASATAAGFDDALLWRESDFLADPVLSTRLRESNATFRDAFEKLRHEHFDPRALKLTQSFRPFCAAFKMVALWRALQQSEEGDFVMWTDSSRYFSNITLSAGLLQGAIDMLRGAISRSSLPLHVTTRWRTSPWYARRTQSGRWAPLHVNSALGLLTCSGWDCETDLYTWNGQQQVISDYARVAYSDLISSGELLQRPLILNANILLRNTAEMQLFVWDWLGMAVAKPHAFCNSHVQDQAAFTILVYNRSLPLINVCPYIDLPSKRGYEPQKCVKHTKSANTFLELLGRGAFEVVPSSDYDELREGYAVRGGALPVTDSLHMARLSTAVDTRSALAPPLAPPTVSTQQATRATWSSHEAARKIAVAPALAAVAAPVEKAVAVAQHTQPTQQTTISMNEEGGTRCLSPRAATEGSALVRVAVCYHGLQRSSALVVESHRQHLFKPLQHADVHVDTRVFVHTWTNGGQDEAARARANASLYDAGAVIAVDDQAPFRAQLFRKWPELQQSKLGLPR